jgi:hypothetical protein
LLQTRSLRLLSVPVMVSLAILGVMPTVTFGAMGADWVAKWEEDLTVAHHALREKHPSPFDHLSEAEMQVKFDRLIERLPELNHPDVIVELARIVALMEDGHTRLTLPLAPGVDFRQGHSETERPALPEMEFHQYPLRLGVGAAGEVWVEGTTQELQRLVGARLVAIDSRSIAEALDLVSSTIRADNAMQVLHHLPMHLVLAELLHATDVAKAADRAIFTVERRDGLVEEIGLDAVPGGTSVNWVLAGQSRGDALPLHRQRNEENFWATWLEPQDLVYLQFNAVHDKEDETIRQFSKRLSTLVEQHPESAVVIDLRNNRGGNQSLGLPLLHAVIASPQNCAGRLFTIIGRATFSAAMTFSLQMERHTQTLFVGEPTGSKPNHYGDSRKTLLPNSNITLRISSLYWQWSPRDDREWIAPHAEAPPTLEAESAGMDPAMALIESLTGKAGRSEENGSLSVELSGEWRGNLPPASFGSDSVLRLHRDAEALRAVVDVPPFGLDGAATENLSLEAGEIAFQISIGSETISYQGRIMGPWIVGHGDLGSVRFPFLLRRSSDL